MDCGSTDLLSCATNSTRPILDPSDVKVERFHSGIISSMYDAVTASFFPPYLSQNIYYEIMPMQYLE